VGEKREHNQRTYTIRLVANRAQMDKLNAVMKKAKASMPKRLALSAILSEALNTSSVEHLAGVVNAAGVEALERIAAEKREIEKARLAKTKLAIAKREEEIAKAERKAAERLSS